MEVVVTRIVPLWLRLRGLSYGPAEILRHFAIAAPPVPIEQIAMGLGVRLHYIRQPGWDGALRSSPAGDADIWIDAGGAKVRQRFTIAHELGHLFLHPLGTEWRDAAEHWQNPNEIAANLFAADFLMPRAMVIAYRAYYQTLHELADVFAVSRPAMKRRFHELGLRVP